MELPVFFCAVCAIAWCYGSVVEWGFCMGHFDSILFSKRYSAWAPTMSLPDTTEDAIFRHRELGNVIDTSDGCGEQTQPAAVLNCMSRPLFTGQFY